jgi:vacuolar-type H+-ATPase subunit F/Vma7
MIRNDKSFNIGCIACPTLFKWLNHYLNEKKSHPVLVSNNCNEKLSLINIKLFEFDNRFSIYGDNFHFYDYNKPYQVDKSFEGYFDLIISDPPYLAQECHTKVNETIQLISKSDYKLIICTGAVMEDIITTTTSTISEKRPIKLLSFIPRHERNLANEFRCYANYKTVYLD